MSLREEILKKVPISLKEGNELKMILEYVKKTKVKEIKKLEEHLKHEISKTEAWLSYNMKGGGTMIKAVRDKSIELKSLEKCLQLVKRHLV